MDQHSTKFGNFTVTMTLNEAKQSTHNIRWLMMMMVTLQLTMTYDTKFGYKRFSGSEGIVQANSNWHFKCLL